MTSDWLRAKHREHVPRESLDMERSAIVHDNPDESAAHGHSRRTPRRWKRNDQHTHDLSRESEPTGVGTRTRARDSRSIGLWVSPVKEARE